MRRQASACVRWSHESLVTVRAATGTLPTASTSALRPMSPPPICSISHSASGADSVSFHNFAGCTGSSSASSATMPCCCPPTLIAATPPTGSMPACAVARSYAISSAAHQSPGICSLTGGVTTGWGDEPRPTTRPVSRSRISTLVDCVDESIPATKVMRPTLDPVGRSTPRVVEGDVADRLAFQRPVVADRNAERDAGRHGDVLGNGEQIT